MVKHRKWGAEMPAIFDYCPLFDAPLSFRNDASFRYTTMPGICQYVILHKLSAGIIPIFVQNREDLLGVLTQEVKKSKMEIN